MEKASPKQPFKKATPSSAGGCRSRHESQSIGSGAEGLFQTQLGLPGPVLLEEVVKRADVRLAGGSLVGGPREPRAGRVVLGEKVVERAGFVDLQDFFSHRGFPPK